MRHRGHNEPNAGRYSLLSRRHPPNCNLSNATDRQAQKPVAKWVLQLVDPASRDDTTLHKQPPASFVYLHDVIGQEFEGSA